MRPIARAFATTLALLVALSAAPARAQDAVWSAKKGLVLKGRVVTMDAKRRVIENGSVFVKDGLIVAIAGPGEALPADARNATVIETKGVIAPGLIDAHNHTEYDFLRMWDVPALYHEMYDWMGSPLYDKAIKAPKRLVSAELELGSEIGKYSEVKSIVGGATAVQGSPPDSAYSRHFVRNVEFPNFGRDRVRQRSIGIMDTHWRDGLSTGLLADIKAGKVDAWLVHLAEGTNEKSRAEFADLEKLGLLGKWCVIIHGTSLKAEDYKKMAAADAKLVTSPLDNFLLYGQTADIVAAAKAGVTVSIGSDWSPFGSKNLLAELKICHELNKTTWKNYFTDQNFIEMVTINPARTVGWESYAGHLAPGLHADITVFDAVDPNAYTSIVRATEANVQLVLVEGEPLYGDLDRMKLLKGKDCEIVFEAAGRKKAVDITTDDPKVKKGKQTFAELKGLLQSALSMDPDFLYAHSKKAATMSKADFAKYVKKNYPMAPATLDPVAVIGDTHYFDTIKRAPNAAFPFDIRKYYDGGVGITSTVTPP